jgi:hypothetical protein
MRNKSLASEEMTVSSKLLHLRFYRGVNSLLLVSQWKILRNDRLK